jgi:polysaccharide transporter, PST family
MGPKSPQPSHSGTTSDGPSAGMLSVMASNLVIHASAAIAPAVAMSVLLRRVGFAEFGSVLAIQTLVALFVGISDLGCSILGLQRIAKRHHSSTPAAASRAVRLFAAMRLTSALTFGALLVAYMLVFKQDDLLLVIPAVGLFFAQALTPTWALLALEATRRNAPRVVLARVVWVVIAAAFVRHGLTYLCLVAVLNLVILHYTRRSVVEALGVAVSFHEALSVRRFARTVRATAGFSLSRVAVNLYQTAPLLIVSHAAPAVVAGMYATIETVHKLFVTATYPLTDALFSRTARTRSLRPFMRYGLPLLALFLAGIVVCALSAETVLSVVGGGRALAAAPSLRLMMIASAAAVTSVFMGYPLAGALGHVHAVNRTTLVGPIVLAGVFAIGFAAQLDTLRVAVTAVFVAELTVVLYRVAIAKRTLRSSGVGRVEVGVALK